MMRILAILFLFMVACVGAQAQGAGCGPSNPQCIIPTAPPGTSTNQAASTAFVTGAIAAIPALPSISALLDQLGATRGDILYRGASGWATLAPGTSGQLLQSGGASANPSWVPPPTTGVQSINGLTGTPAIIAGAGISVSVSSPNITITNTGAATGIPNASGSTTATTGTIASGSTALTLASAIDFANGQGILIPNAGPVATVQPPASATATPHVGGSSTFSYQVASVDANGGMSTAVSASTSIAASTVACSGTTLNYIVVNVTGPSTGTAPVGYAIFGNQSGSLTLLGFTNSGTFFDCGGGALASRPAWTAASPPGAATHEWLKTSIVSGGGTTSLTLANMSSNAVSAGTVIHDDTAAITGAINALPANGGAVDLGVSSYNVSSPLMIGNGSAGVYSTTRGVILRGQSNAVSSVFWAYPALPAAQLIWQGAPGAAVVQLNGPLQGFGLQSVQMNCNNTATYGLFVLSAQFGISSNLLMNRCEFGMFATTVAPFGGNDTDNLHSDWYQTIVQPPQNGFFVGMYLTGSVSNATTDYNNFFDVMIGSPGGNNGTGLYLQESDGNFWQGVHLTNALSFPILFDYSGPSAVYPDANFFFGIDPGGNSAQIANIGSPSGAGTNAFYGTLTGNGGSCPTLANLACH